MPALPLGGAIVNINGVTEPAVTWAELLMLNASFSAVSRHFRRRPSQRVATKQRARRRFLPDVCCAASASRRYSSSRIIVGSPVTALLQCGSVQPGLIAE